MKKLITFTLMFFTLSMMAADKDVSITRSHLYNRFALTKNLGANFSLFAMAANRYNLSITKDVNEKEMDVDKQDFWLQEGWLGLMWKQKIPALKASYMTMLTYRAIYNNLSEMNDTKAYLRHTSEWHHKLVKPLTKSISLHYRTILWLYLPGEDGDDIELDTELYNRHLAGLTYRFTELFSYTFDEEIFLKLTADDNDTDGNKELFHKNAIWTGPSIHLDKFSIDLRYIFMYTVKEDSDALSMKVYDHYGMITLKYSLD